MLLEKLLKKRGNYEVRKYFNEIATQWDSMSKEFYSVKVRDKILSMVYPEPGYIIADIGCGTGFISEGLIHGPASVIAIDGSEEMLNEMKMKFRHADLEMWFKDAGFTNISVQCIEEYCCSTAVKEKENARISIFLASGEKPKKTQKL